MSEDIEVYLAENERKTQLQFIAKRLVDLTKDFIELEEEEKKYIIERADKLHGYGLVDLYNALNEYME